MRLRFITLLGIGVALAAGAAGCAAAEGADQASGDELAGSTSALAASDFADDVDKPFLASINTLSRDAFEAKWDAARSNSAVMFFRAYPAGYHADFAKNLTASARSKIPEGVGVCLGDAHPENFGFLALGSKVIYGFNDLDDSGYCPVALDALRYVTAVRMTYDDPDLTERVARHYAETLSGERSGADARDDITKVRDKLAPNFDAEHRADRLDSFVKNDLIHEDGLESVSSSTRAALERAIVRALPTATVLDVAMLSRDHGGSGGLDRYWALIRRGAFETMLELKESDKPGVDYGLSARPIASADRLTVLKRELWNTSVEDDYFAVTALGKNFVVRDRLAKNALDLGKLGKKDLEDVLDAQAATLGLLHAKVARLAAGDATKARKKWLIQSAETLADRWKKASK